MRSPRILAVAAALLAGLALATAKADASSIVYQRNGNLYLTTPDGSAGYALTSNGGWSDPSQADNGMIVALRDGLLYRLDRSGRTLGAPVQGVGGATDHVVNGTTQFYGPFDPQVSPDGSQIAYWDTVSQQRVDANCGCVHEELVNVTTTTAADHFTSGGFISHAEMPRWIRGSDRLTATDSGEEPQALTWVNGSESEGEQWWFRDRQYVIQDIALSPDGSRIAAMGTTQGITAPDDTVRLWASNGPPFTGQPPYDNNAPDAQFPSPPTVICNNHHGGQQLSHPSWAPDSSALVFDGPDGIWVNHLDRGMSDCSGLHEQLLIPGGHQPSWGPANVDPSQAPGNGGPPGGGTPGGGTPGGGTPPPTSHLSVRLRSRSIGATELRRHGLMLLLDGLRRGRVIVDAYLGRRDAAHLSVLAPRPGRGSVRVRAHAVRRGARLRIVVRQGIAAATVTAWVR